MRIPAKVDYAVRALAELVGGEEPRKAEDLALAQDLPLKYLHEILRDLRRNRLVVSQRGPEGGFALAREADAISLADIFRAIDGPLAEIHGLSLRTLEYRGAAADLSRVWMAVRASLRQVLEQVTLADLAAGRLPEHVELLADQYEATRGPGGLAVTASPEAG